jgi:hypothetical protein
VKWKESYQASHERQIRRGVAAGTQRKRYGSSGHKAFVVAWRAWGICPQIRVNENVNGSFFTHSHAFSVRHVLIGVSI